jgi:hypothetical protein
MQALFGFQAITVFNERFEHVHGLSPVAHLLSLAMVAVASAPGMAPVAFHRIAEPGRVSRRFITLSSPCICAALIFPITGTAWSLLPFFHPPALAACFPINRTETPPWINNCRASCAISKTTG